MARCYPQLQCAPGDPAGRDVGCYSGEEGGGEDGEDGENGRVRNPSYTSPPSSLSPPSPTAHRHRRTAGIGNRAGTPDRTADQGSSPADDYDRAGPRGDE